MVGKIIQNLSQNKQTNHFLCDFLITTNFNSDLKDIEATEGKISTIFKPFFNYTTITECWDYDFS